MLKILYRSALGAGILLLAAGSAKPAGLLPPIPGAWKTWAPRPALKADADVVTEDGVPCLRLRSRGFPSYGKWTASASVRPGASYRFEVLYRTSAIASEDTSIAVIASWTSGQGKAVQRDYIDSVTQEADGWRRASRILKAPADAQSATLELGLRWADRGSVLWKRAELSEVDAPAPRRVRVVTTRIAPAEDATVAKNLALMAETFDRAAAEKPDLVLFTENLVDRGVAVPLEETAQTIPGPATDMLAERARRYKTWVATSLHEREGDLLYNTAVLIDRHGRIAGKYRKVHLATVEGERGITPGSDYPVFDTDFGRVGMLVCWDNWFVEPARVMRLKGAELLLLPIAGDGVPGHWDVISRARAIDNGVFVVSASTNASSPSRIIDPYGKVLAEASTGIASADIDLSADSRVFWLSVGPALGDPRSLYIKERRPDTYDRLAAEPLQ
ncbi:MAG TPA: carbon-nitrogen hydrolase family protein [Bryobacteraceae bacterium]|nr:carbon-nitrogen hydrolase family protein [Bryobacteraceae bacterium]